MKIEINPLEPLKKAAEENVNRMFNEFAHINAHQDAVYTQKKLWARNDRSKLKDEADLKGVNVDDLAEKILQQPDILHTREMRRQRALKLVRDSRTIDELMAIKGDQYD